MKGSTVCGQDFHPALPLFWNATAVVGYFWQRVPVALIVSALHQTIQLQGIAKYSILLGGLLCMLLVFSDLNSV